MRKSKFRTSDHRILKAVEAGRTVRDVCREHEISEATCYQWKSKKDENVVHNAISVWGILLGSFPSGPLQRPSPFIDRKVAEQQVLGPDWIEINLDKPLKPVGDYQEIGLTLAPPLELDLLKPFGVRVSGSLILPEVELVTPEGVTMPMKCSGARGKTTLTYRLKNESVKQRYNRIRIRADQEVHLKAIYWTGKVIKNMP